MAKDEYLEIQDLDTTPEADKVTMALIYVTTLFVIGAFVIVQMKLGEYGVGLFGDK
ncbi:MAG: hypothetical protein ACYTGZ_11055 [Planctomycetota bacterium]|jgi:hypothetical protein